MHSGHPGGDAFQALAYPPPNWHFLQPWGDGHAFAHKNGLRVLIDCEEKSDRRRWLHVSVSRKNWIPSHIDMRLVKDAFIGPARYAYFVFPPSAAYVNIHEHCLHLWALAEGDDGRVLPEFSADLEGI